MLFSKNDKDRAAIDTFIKSRKENNKMLYAIGAKYFHLWAKDGRGEYLNYLFANLEPIDQTGMRIYFANRLVDLYGKGGLRNEDDTKWVIRPHSFFNVTVNPAAEQKDENGIPIHFTFVPFADKDAKGDNPGKNRPAWLKALPPIEAKQAIDNMKAMRKACVDAGVEGLTFEWLKRDDAERIQGPADMADAANKMVRTVVSVADIVSKAGFSQAIVDRIVDACPADWFSLKDLKAISGKFAGQKEQKARAAQANAKPKEETQESEESDTPKVDPAIAAKGMEQMGEQAH